METLDYERGAICNNPVRRKESEVKHLAELSYCGNCKWLLDLHHPARAPETKSWKFEKESSTFDGESYVTGGYSPPETNKFKPYIVTIEVEAHNLDEAKAAASILASGDGGGNWSGEVQSVVQKHRMTNIGTEWYRK
jgi:hypothetical protein